MAHGPLSPGLQRHVSEYSQQFDPPGRGLRLALPASWRLGEDGATTPAERGTAAPRYSVLDDATLTCAVVMQPFERSRMRAVAAPQLQPAPPPVQSARATYFAAARVGSGASGEEVAGGPATSAGSHAPVEPVLLHCSVTATSALATGAVPAATAIDAAVAGMANLHAWPAHAAGTL